MKQLTIVLAVIAVLMLQCSAQTLTSQKTIPVIPRTEKYAAFFAMIEELGPSINTKGPARSSALPPVTQSLPYGLTAADIATILPIIKASRATLVARDQQMISDRNSTVLSATAMAKYQADRQSMIEDTIAKVQKAVAAKVWQQLDSALGSSSVAPVVKK